MGLSRIGRKDDYEFGGDVFDVRGWTVRTRADDEKAGTVEALLVDASGEIRYLDVDLGFMKKHVLLPLAYARADREEELVWVDGLTHQAFEDLPELAHDVSLLTADYEDRLTARYAEAARREARASVDEPPPTPSGPPALERLSDLKEYRIRGEDDPRGWKVVGGDGGRIGTVEELLIDTRSLHARYAVVSVDEKKLDLERIDRRVLLPLDRVELDRPDRRVVAGGLFGDDVAAYPVYGGLPLAAEAERELALKWARDASTAPKPSPSPSRDAKVHDRRRNVSGAREVADRFFGREPRATRATRVGEGEEVVVEGTNEEVRIRQDGDDVVVERHRND